MWPFLKVVPQAGRRAAGVQLGYRVEAGREVLGGWPLPRLDLADHVITDVDPGAEVITLGHVADGNVHVNIVPAAPADGRHENAVFSLVASLGGPSPPSTASAP